jgi:colanic acid/amylovoran biosynthesis glycosyltransferase
LTTTSIAINFCGALSSEEVQKHYQRADIFVLPSLVEGWPTVLAEAMATGLPVIATRVGGIPEIISHESNGILIAVESVKEIKDTIKKLLDNAYLREKIGSKAREKTESFDVKLKVKELIDIFNLDNHIS